MVDTPAGSAPATPSATPSASAPATSAPSSAPSATTGSSGSWDRSLASTSPAPAIGSAAPGAPPQERWESILTNARAKTRAEVEQEYRQRYSKYDQFEQDPWAAVQDWLGQAERHSLYGPMVRQWAQQRSAPPPGTPKEEPQANVPIVDANGNIVDYTYSDKALRQWQAWNKAQLDTELDQRFGALEQHAARQARRDEQQSEAYEAYSRASTTLGQLRRMPYFSEHESAIRQALEEHEEWGDNVHQAYNHVLLTQILPTLSQAEQRRVVGSLTGKAAGSTVAPGGTAPAAPRFKNFLEAAEYYSTHPDEAAAMANR